MRYLLLSNGDPGTPPGSSPTADVTTFILQAEEAGAIFLAGAIERPTTADVSPATGPATVAEFVIVDVASRAEAVAWAGRLAAASGTTDIEVRRVYLPEDRPSAREGVG